MLMLDLPEKLGAVKLGSTSKTKRANNNPLLGGKGKYYVTNLDVDGGKTGYQQTMPTGTITPDLSLGLDGGKKEGQ
jgi:hypothetical protein